MSDEKSPLSLERGWFATLRRELEETVKRVLGDERIADVTGNRGLASDIPDIEGVFEIKRFEFGRGEEFWIYASVGKQITEIYEVRALVYQMLGVASEDYFVLVPFVSSEMLQFWFMIGTESHGHIGRVILTKEDNPHIRMG